MAGNSTEAIGAPAAGCGAGCAAGGCAGRGTSGCAVRGSAGGSGVEVMRAATSDVALAIDWATAESFAVAPPGAGFTAPSALFVESPTYQTAPVVAVQFAMCGQYQISDGEVWQGVLE